MTIILKTPFDVAIQIAEKAKARRLALNLSQQTLSARSGVSYGVIKKFERTGQISLESLLKISLILETLPEFENLFSNYKTDNFTSLDEIIKDKTRKRGRQ